MAKHKLKYLKTAAPVSRKRKRLVPILLLAVISVLAVTVGLTWNSVAKYLQETNNEGVAKAKEFYFTSDYLSAEGKKHIVSPGADGTVDVSFELRNYDGLNVSELDITYEVSVQPSVEVTSSGDKTISVSEKTETVTLHDLRAGTTYTVTVTGSNGYSHTLKATFEVEPAPTGIFKNTTNYGDYALLTVWAEGTGGTVTITVPTGLIPDATDDMLTGKDAGSTVALTLKAYESRTFRFFTTATYTGEKIPVSGIDEETPLN